MWKRKCKYNNKNKYRIPVFEKRPEKWELEISFLHIQINVEYISQYCLLVHRASRMAKIANKTTSTEPIFDTFVL